MVHFLEPCKVSLSNLIICCVLRITLAEACHGHQNLPTVVPPLSKPRIGFHEALANIPTAAQDPKALYPPLKLSPWKHDMKKREREREVKRYSLMFFTSHSSQINFWWHQFNSHSLSHWIAKLCISAATRKTLLTEVSKVTFWFSVLSTVVSLSVSEERSVYIQGRGGKNDGNSTYRKHFQSHLKASC